MLRLHLPQPMPHALPRDRPLDFYTPSRSVKADPAQAMQLPVPSYTNPRELDAFIRRRPLTPPSDSAMSMSSLPPVRASNPAANGHGAPDYTYQLPAIGNHVRANPSRSSTPQSQHSHQAQDMNFSQQQTSRSGNGAISERVRIPASIKTPQESLAALAAEVSLGVSSNS